MTDYKLNEQDYKRLTELLGECSKPNCVGCDKDHTNCNNWEKYLRTFNTPDDQHAVFKKLVEVRKWDGFYKFFLKKANFIIPAIVGYDCVSAEVKWLFINPERFCKLASLYLKEEGK